MSDIDKVKDGLKTIEDLPSGMVRCEFCGANKTRLIPCGECGKIALPSQKVMIISGAVALVLLLITFIVTNPLGLFSGNSKFKNIVDTTNSRMIDSSTRTVTLVSAQVAKGEINLTQGLYLAKQSTDMVMALYQEGRFELRDYAGKNKSRLEKVKEYEEELKILYTNLIGSMNAQYKAMFVNLKN